MSNELILTIRLFGPLRRYEPCDEFQMKVPAGLTSRELLQAIGCHFCKRHPEFRNISLFEHSAIANDKEIFGRDYKITEPGIIAVLPPVCGG